MKKGNLVTLVVIAALGAILLYSTLASQKHECTVTMEFRGMTNTATASAATDEEAMNNARSTACGPITGGMDDTIACNNTPPARKECKTL